MNPAILNLGQVTRTTPHLLTVTLRRWHSATTDLHRRAVHQPHLHNGFSMTPELEPARYRPRVRGHNL
ncbi:hypothetical protein TNCV_2225651 [Trichonephila clavipes]|nr:hypothetical protein TNCV_2225651 [Trichonephila clavipes]